MLKFTPLGLLLFQTIMQEISPRSLAWKCLHMPICIVPQERENKTLALIFLCLYLRGAEISLDLQLCMMPYDTSLCKALPPLPKLSLRHSWHPLVPLSFISLFCQGAPILRDTLLHPQCLPPSLRAPRAWFCFWRKTGWDTGLLQWEP